MKTKLEKKQEELIYLLSNELEDKFGQRTGYLSLRHEIAVLKEQQSSKKTEGAKCKKCGSVDLHDNDFYCLQCRTDIAELITKYK